MEEVCQGCGVDRVAVRDLGYPAVRPFEPLTGPLAGAEDLPAGLLQARDLAREGKLAEHDAGNFEAAEERLRTAGQEAAVVAAGRGGVARQAGERGVVLLLLELAAHLGILL